MPPELVQRVLAAAVARGADARLARALLVEGRRAAIWVRQSTPGQLVDHAGARLNMLDQTRHLAPLGFTATHPQVTVFDAGAETARKASGLTRDDLGPDAAAARAARAAAGDDAGGSAAALGAAGPRDNYVDLVLALDGGTYGALLTTSFSRGGRRDGDNGLLIEVIRRQNILLVIEGVVRDPRVPADLSQIRLELAMAAIQGDSLVLTTQHARLQKARAGGLGKTLPSGLVYASPADPEYVRRLRAAGLGGHIAEAALARHLRPVCRDGLIWYVLPFPDDEVWRSVVLRVRWLRKTRDVGEVLRCIRRGFGPVAERPGEPSEEAVLESAGAPGSDEPGAEPATRLHSDAEVSATLPGAEAGSGINCMGVPEAAGGVGAAVDGTAVDGTAGFGAEPSGAASIPEAGRAGDGVSADLVQVGGDPWDDDRWPAGRERKIPMIRHNVWRHQTRVRWVTATDRALRHWFGAPALYGEFAYTAHGLRPAGGDPDAPAPSECRPREFPAPAGPADRAAFAEALGRVEADGRHRERPSGAAAYHGAHAHALQHLYCDRPYHGREGIVRRSGPRAGLPAGRSPRAPQGFDVCGIHLGAWYGPAGLRHYGSTTCALERGHPSAVTVVVEDVVLAAVVAAVDPAAVRDAVGAWRIAAAVPDAALAGLRAEVARVRAEHAGEMRLAAALCANGNPTDGHAAVARVNELRAALDPLEARLVLAERATAADADLVRADWDLVRQLAADLPGLVDAARSADAALDAALLAAHAAGDDGGYAALAPHAGQLRALLDGLGVSVDVHVGHRDSEGDSESSSEGDADGDAECVARDVARRVPVDGAPGDGAGGPAIPDDGTVGDMTVDGRLAAAAAGGLRPADGSVRVVVRFASGARRVRYADLEHHPSLQPERVWAYARLAAVGAAGRGTVAAAVAAELSAGGQLIHRRKTRRVAPWSAAHARAAAVQYAAREFGHPVVGGTDVAAHEGVGDGTADGPPPVDVPAEASAWPERGEGWQSVAALAAELDVPPTEVVHALLGGLLGPATWTPAAQEVRGGPARALGTCGAGPTGCVGGCGGACGPRCPARCVAVRPTTAQLHAAFPTYAARCVAERQDPPWDAADTVPLRDLAAELGVTKSMARYGAEHGGGLAWDGSGRIFTRRSAYAPGPEVSRDRALAARPELAGLDRAHWRLQADALRALPGVKWVTLRAHAPAITVPGPGGRKTRVWIHLSPDLAARLRRTALSDVVADWNRAHAAARDAADGASSPAGGSTPSGPLTADLCLPRAAVLASLQERGLGIAYQTYQRAVARGAVREVMAVPVGGGPSCAHAVVPRSVQATDDRSVVRAWLDGAYVDPGTWA